MQPRSPPPTFRVTKTPRFPRRIGSSVSGEIVSPDSGMSGSFCGPGREGIFSARRSGNRSWPTSPGWAGRFLEKRQADEREPAVEIDDPSRHFHLSSGPGGKNFEKRLPHGEGREEPALYPLVRAEGEKADDFPFEQAIQVIKFIERRPGPARHDENLFHEKPVSPLMAEKKTNDFLSGGETAERLRRLKGLARQKNIHPFDYRGNASLWPIPVQARPTRGRRRRSPSQRMSPPNTSKRKPARIILVMGTIPDP